MHIWIDDKCSRSKLLRAAGERQGDETFDRAYSNLTPTVVEECEDRWAAGLWRPFWVMAGNQPLVWHYLHDMSGEHRSAWVSGFGYPEVRGRQPWQVALRTACWQAALWHCTKVWPYDRLFSYVMKGQGAEHWNEVCCGYTKVGVLHHAVPENDDLADIIVYSQRKEDIALAIEQANAMFPEGAWEVPRMPTLVGAGALEESGLAG